MAFIIKALFPCWDPGRCDRCLGGGTEIDGSPCNDCGGSGKA